MLNKLRIILGHSACNRKLLPFIRGWTNGLKHRGCWTLTELFRNHETGEIRKNESNFTIMGATDQERKKLTLLKIFHLLSVFLRELIPREMTLRIINNYSSGSESSWAIDSEAMRAKGIIVLVKSN